MRTGGWRPGGCSSDVSGDVDRLQVMPWDAQETLGPDGTRREMRAAEAQLGENLRKLSDATSGDGLSRELTADVARDVQILELLRQKVTDRDAAGALMQRMRSDLVHRVIRADLDLGAAKYEAAATRARSLASVGSGILLLGLFLAFAITLGRLLRTKRKHAVTEERLRQAHKMEAVGQLAGGIAHDFNNLLTATTGYTALLSARVADDEIALRYTGEIERASAHAALLTEQLLAFSGMQALRPRTINLNTVVAETRAILDRLIAADVEVDVEFDADLPWVHADPALITGVLLSLCTNAQDAMPNGGTLRVETRAVEVDAETALLHGVGAGRFAMLSVTDSGSGIDETIRDRIFEPFFTTKPAGKATGLGLASAYGTVQQSSGFIVAESPDETGARFSVYLPGVAALVPELAYLSVDDARDSAATVLVVEDEPAVRRLVAEILKGAGCRVITAATGAEALACFDDHPEIEVLLSDVVMPGINGPELAERLRLRNPDLPVIFMSGYTGEALVGRGVTADAHVIRKPFTATELLRAVRRLTERTADLVA